MLRLPDATYLEPPLRLFFVILTRLENHVIITIENKAR